MRFAILAAAACAVAGCSAQRTATVEPIAAERPTPSMSAVNVRPGTGAWTSDPRWGGCVGKLGSAADAAARDVSAMLGFTFERGREPLVVADAAAPERGDVVVRFVDGVRRPYVRVPPRRLLSGEFVPGYDLKALVAEGAILLAAGDREPPDWFRSGASLVVADALERALRRKMLGGPAVLADDAAVFGGPDGEELASAVRVSALLRIARTERPLGRFLTVIGDGGSEDAALSALGIGGRAFLDAATETDRIRALEVVAGDPLLPALRTARAAIAAGEFTRADAALQPEAKTPTGASGDIWLVADARLCQAQIALSRGDTKDAAASLTAARFAIEVLRVRDGRIVEAAVAPPAERPALLRALAADWPDALSLPVIAALVPVPETVAAQFPALRADLVSADPAARRQAAARLGETGSRDAAPSIRTLLADPDATVRRAAIAALALVLGRDADDDVENATKDADAAVRRTALDLLAVSDRARAAKRAAAMKDDPDAGVRARAAELTLGK